MSIRSPDIKADYLQIRNIEIVRGDTFGLASRVNNNGTPIVLDENGIVTFAIFDRSRQIVIKKTYTSEEQDSAGYVEAYLLPSETSALKKSENYTYEIEWLINSGTIYTILQGQIMVLEDKITTSNRGVQHG